MTFEEKKIFLLLSGWKPFIHESKYSENGMLYAWTLNVMQPYNKDSALVASDFYLNEQSAIEWAYDYITRKLDLNEDITK